jgi:hypothetical protein
MSLLSFMSTQSEALYRVHQQPGRLLQPGAPRLRDRAARLITGSDKE